MLKNNILIALRYFRKNKFFTLLNIIGLAVGIATALLSFMFIASELSYDRFHDKSDRIYRIAVDALSGNTIIRQTFTSAAYSDALYTEFSEIEASCRFSTAGPGVRITVDDQTYVENNIIMVDTTYFDIFSAAFIYGQPSSSILAPNMVVLTKQTAQRYFGDKNPIGQQVVMDDEINLQVSAVIEDYPVNSHFHFSMLVSLVSFDGFYNNPNWFANNFQNYILLQQGYNYRNLEVKFPAFVDKYLFEGHYADVAVGSNKWELYLQPLTSIHLNSHLSGEIEPNGNISYIYIFGMGAIFILIIACINYVNLSTAKSTLRAREIGIRKCLGSNRQAIIRQFLSESILISTSAMVLALVLVEVGKSSLETMLNIQLVMPIVLHNLLIPLLVVLTIAIGLAAGFYPAKVLASYQPLTVLRANLLKGKSKSWSRNTLVILQFSISIFLIISTLIISRQLDFIQNECLGFEKEQVLVIKNINTISDRLDGFVNEINQLSGVSAVSVSNRVIGQRFSNIGFGAEGLDNGFTLNLTMVDENYQDVMKFNISRGRFFSSQYSTDTAGVILNQAAVDLIGWDEPLGKTVTRYNDQGEHRYPVLGVIENLHYQTKHTSIQPMAFFHMDSDWGWTPRHVSVRFTSNNVSRLVSSIERIWNNINKESRLDYSFFDDEYDTLYQNEQKTRQMYIVFTFLAVFIACLGLFGLAAFMVERRTQEIGVRKVLGASVSDIIAMLCREFSIWVIMANIVAWPLAWITMSQWLGNFAYRISINPLLFIIAGALALAIALLTVSYQAVKAATTNPVDTLRYE